MTAAGFIGVDVALGAVVVLVSVFAEPLLERRRARRASVAATAAPEPAVSRPAMHPPCRCSPRTLTAPSAGEHDRIEDMPAIELLAFAAIVAPLSQRVRPPDAADQDSTEFRW